MVKKFFKVLSIELSELEENLHMMSDIVSKRYQSHEITEYVHLENVSLLVREGDDVAMIHKRILSLNPDDYKNLDEAKDAVLGVINGFSGLPKAVYIFMESRVTKVIRYLNEMC